MLHPNEIINDRYVLEEYLASGGMGQVWKAKDNRLSRIVALKILKLEYADNQLFLDRFQTEAKNTAKLNDPNIARIFDYGESVLPDSGEKIVFLAIEFIPGKSLSQLLKDQAPAPLELATTLNIFEQAASGLATAHEQGLIHRDIKPGNIMVDGNRVKITDFGISKAINENNLTQQGVVLGTATYISPEQAKDETVTPASDIYSLGVVAYESLTGKPPFKGDTAVSTAIKHVKNPLPPLPNSIPEPLQKIVEKALAKAPADRYQNGGELLAALKQLNLPTTNEKNAKTANMADKQNFWENFTFGWSTFQKSLLILSAVMLLLGVLGMGFFIAMSKGGKTGTSYTPASTSSLPTHKVPSTSTTTSPYTIIPTTTEVTPPAVTEETIPTIETTPETTSATTAVTPPTSEIAEENSSPTEEPEYSEEKNPENTYDEDEDEDNYDNQNDENDYQYDE